MLNIIDTLDIFFEDCYRKVNVREYSRLKNISAPTASKILNSYFKEGLLKKEQDRLYLYFYANRESWLFIDLSRIYWKTYFERSGFLKQLASDFKFSKIILFGSLSKAEVTPNSDIDLAIFSSIKKSFNYSKFEKIFKRKMQIFNYCTDSNIKNKELLNNILLGYKM